MLGLTLYATVCVFCNVTAQLPTPSRSLPQQKYRDLYESDKLRYDKEMGEYVSKHGHAALTKLMGNKGKRAAGSRS